MSTFAFSQENTTTKVKTKINATTLSAKKETKTNTADRTLMADKQKKEKYIKFSSSEFRERNNIPADFPRYKDTGNLRKDTKNYDILLKQWIADNNDKYEEIKEIINF
jgi:hypothetical protein